MIGAQLFFYLADEGGNALDVNLNAHKGSLLASGSRSDIGDWQLHLKSMDDVELHYCGFYTLNFHNLSDLVEENLASRIKKHGLQLSDSSVDSPNVLVFQIIGGFPFTTDIVLISGTSSESSRIEERVNYLTDSESITVGKAAIGNLLGGIGYFYGQSKIALPRIPDLKEQVDILSYWPAELYTAVPSRPGFPRGFLWDEGFHQLLIWRWDIHISLDIIGHWLDLMNIDGWIPREQILGAEALSRVPEEYVPQHPTNGNPPTLLLALSDIVSGLKDNKFTAMDRNDISLFLNHAFVRLEAWFQWFNTTQSVMFFEIVTSKDNTLSSGLDDYPRASHPSNDERHLDIRCWMFLAADCINSIEDLLNKETKPDKNYGSTAKLLSDLDLLNQIHFDDAYGAYFDFGNHTEKVELKWREVDVGHNNTTWELVRVFLEKPELRFVPHIGYVSLFPFIARIIPPESWILEKQLELISNSSLFWTNYGLRSLAKTREWAISGHSQSSVHRIEKQFNQFQGEHKESLYWGTYRPQVYLGIRARTPQSLIAGLMWINERDNKYQLRHVCKHEDELSTYGWTKHNGRDFGHQVLADHAMILTTVFLKSKGAGSGYGGDWAVRIDGQIDK
ncbi:hypothetical protein RIF29_41850 [Crotalaria pallida]|uniref:Mannosyl-oligosaccharide glucosidase n=1 Tax=Crotalaria pallida TaxID=3830 RepID=A0AAN9HS14_CROPI